MEKPTPSHPVFTHKKSKGSFQVIGHLLVRYFISSWMTRQTRIQAAFGVVLPIVAVAIGVGALTVVLSVMGGFVHGLKSRLLGFEPHLEIVRRGGFGFVPENDQLVQTVRAHIPGALEVAPFIRSDALLQSGGRASTVQMMGIEPTLSPSYGRHTGQKHLEGLIGPQEVEGSFPHQVYPGAILGHELATILGASEGEAIVATSTTSQGGPGGLAPLQQPFVVAGTMVTGSAVFDAKWVLVPLPVAQTFFELQGAWSGLSVRLENPLEAPSIAAHFDVILEPLGLRAKPWTEANEALLRALKLERWGMGFVLYMIILVGCFCITITLVLAVKRKSREMAILMSMGMSKGDLGLLYLLEGALIGLCGVALGIGVGLALLHVVSQGPLWIGSWAVLPRPLPVVVDWGDVAWAGGASFLLAIVAAVWPAWAVMQIQVVETLADR